MKTAMQEMIQTIIDIESKTFNQEQLYMLTALKVTALILLKKEKEQIVEAVEFGLFNMHTTIDGKYYYDLKYKLEI